MYFGPENNKILRVSLPINGEIDIFRVKSDNKRDYDYFVKKTIAVLSFRRPKNRKLFSGHFINAAQ